MIYDMNKPNILGESPIWNYFNDTFYWVDIEDYKIKKYNEFYGEYLVSVNNKKIKPTCLALIDANQIFTTVEDGFGIYDFRVKKGFNYIYTPDFVDDEFRSKLRFNDGKCDRDGNFYIGTMDLESPRKPIGSIYKLEPHYFSIKANKVFDNISVTNGLSFTTNNKYMFFSDTPQKKIYMCKPLLSLQKVNHKLVLGDKNSNRCPDGSTVDIENNYYSCLWGGYGIDVFSTINGNFSFKKKIETSKKFNTCCCFGGKDMNKLFITSANNPDDPNDNGSVIIKPMNTFGLKEHPINLNFTN